MGVTPTSGADMPRYSPRICIKQQLLAVQKALTADNFGYLLVALQSAGSQTHPIFGDHLAGTVNGVRVHGRLTRQRLCLCLHVDLNQVQRMTRRHEAHAYRCQSRSAVYTTKRTHNQLIDRSNAPPNPPVTKDTTPEVATRRHKTRRAHD